MNLGRQGDSAFEEAFLTSELVPRLRQCYVVYSFFKNDVTDLDDSLSDKEMERYIRQDVANISYPKRSDPAPLIARRERNAEPLLEQLFIVKAWRFLRVGQARVAHSAERGSDPNDGQSLGWRYTKKAILSMRYVAQQHGAEFIGAPITITERPQFEILQMFARENSLPFVDTWEALSSDRSLYLPGDGHFNGKGAQTMAEMIAAFIAAHPNGRTS